MCTTLICDFIRSPRLVLSAAILTWCALSSGAFPIITDVVETGGDNDADDTVTAKWTGVTWSNHQANEPVNGLAAGAPYTAGLFGHGAPAMVDRNHRYYDTSAALPIPEYLRDQEYILSGNDNRDNGGYRLDVTVSEAAQVYLLVDNRLQDANNANPPTFGPNMQWVLDEGWTAVMTGANRTADPTLPDEVGIDEGADGTLNQWFSVYTKTFPAGTFTLLQADNAGQNMYGVVVGRPADSANNPPGIVDLVPANNTLFYAATNGLSFKATTLSPNSIAPQNIHLLLNGEDVTASLIIGGSPTGRTAAYSNLTANTIYTGRIVVSDQDGRSTTNDFTFDTLNVATAVVVEAEDYNFGSGSFQSPAPPGSYAGQTGTPDVDYHESSLTPATVYRPSDFVGLATAADGARQYFTDAGATDYQVNQFLAGDWMNYTRSFDNQTYYVYLRAAATAAAQQVRLHKVTNADLPDQTAFALGTFSVVTNIYSYAPLADAFGNAIRLNFSGVAALRLTALYSANPSLQLNFLLFAPTTSAASPPYLSEASPGVNASDVPLDSVLQITLANGAAPVAPGSVALRFNGSDVTGAATVSPNAEGVAITYDPPGNLSPNTTYPVQVSFNVVGGGTIHLQWTFHTVPYKPIIVSVVETGGDDSVNAPAQFTGQTFNHPNLSVIRLGTFQEDAPSYRNRLHQWNGASATLPLPDYLVGGEYIMILQENRDNNPYQLDVEISEPAFVYLLVDNRLSDANNANPPDFSAGSMAWLLADGWTPVLNGLNRNNDSAVPDEVGVDEGGDGVGPGVAINQWSSVYMKRIEENLSLFQADNAGQNMYGVVVRSAAATRPVFAPPTLHGTTLTLSWTGGGRLQQAPEVTGSWTDVPGNPPGSFTTQTTGQRMFYRVVSP